MAIDRTRLIEIFTAIGEKLTRPAMICVFGSAPGILRGQRARSTQDIDVWEPRSDFDLGDLERACKSAGLLFDPKGDIDPEAVYLQVVRPGIVALPTSMAVERLGRFGQLTVVMPTPAVLAAAKLARGSERDIADVAWWTSEAAIRIEDVNDAVARLPILADAETARENLDLVFLIGKKHSE